MAPQQFQTNDFPPPNWTLPADERYKAAEPTRAWWESHENHESGEPPLYYSIAGLWLNLGRVLGITGAWLLYWVRFLNVFVAGTLAWTGFVAAKLVFPEREFIHLSVPVLMAVWPQTTFYSTQSDSLSPRCFGIAYIGLVELLKAEPPSLPLAIWSGLALAATSLVKDDKHRSTPRRRDSFDLQDSKANQKDCVASRFGTTRCIDNIRGRPDRCLVCVEPSHIRRFYGHRLEN